MSRLASITNQNATYASYKYLGAGRFVEEDYAAPGVRLSYDPDGDNSFSALDRFGRVVDQLWERYGQTPVVLDHYCYTYDRAGNRTSRTNELNHDFDELYDYDGIDRLISSTRADDFDQSWALDGLGNFAEFDDDGESQTRTVNGVNEITGITGGWISPSYDAAGNMISGPKPGDETTRVHYVYDAWNRLVKVYDDDSGQPGDLVAEYEYDGTNRRVEKEVAGASHAHYYFNHDWQLLEERFVDEEDELLASNQYVWSVRYIDAPIVRFHDGNGDGDLLDVEDNIRYYTGDANYNVTATIDAASGVVVDRYVYTAYGKATVYDDEWTNPSAPATDGPLYCGYFFDAESGLYQVRNRFYDAGVSTFISRDPVGYFDAHNMYLYARSHPLLLRDPLGLWVNNQCTADCEDVCAQQYPSFWQWPQYAGCVQGCNLGCQGQDFTICNYVNNWSDCYELGFQCACGIAAIPDAFPAPPVASQIIGGIDCACAVVTAIQEWCGGKAGKITSILVAAVDCGMDLVNVNDNYLNFWVEVIVESINEAAVVAGGGVSSPEACIDWWCKCK